MAAGDGGVMAVDLAGLAPVDHIDLSHRAHRGAGAINARVRRA